MDIRNFALKPTAVIHLRDGADQLMYADEAQEKPMRVHVYGPGSKQFAAAEARNTRRIMESMKARGKPVEQTDLRLDLLVAVTDHFENVELDGLQGEALHRAVYSDNSLRFIADQVNAFVNDTANFTKSSPQSSSSTSDTLPG